MEKNQHLSAAAIIKTKFEIFYYIIGLILAAVLIFHRFFDGSFSKITEKKLVGLLIFGSFFYLAFAGAILLLILNRIKKIRSLKKEIEQSTN